MSTQLEYYLGYDVSHLTDEEWAMKVAHLDNIRKREAEENKQ